MAILPKVIYRFKLSPSSLTSSQNGSIDFYTEIEKTTLNFIWNQKKSSYGQDNPKQNRMVLVPKQTYRPMAQNRGLRSNATHLQPSDL